MSAPTKQYFAFISYNHKDVKWAKWLQRKLEWYRLPSKLETNSLEPRFIRPIFRDRDTLTSGVLSEEIQKNLDKSKFLIVLCSPNSARSEWVGEEVQYFLGKGRLDEIIPFIIDGHPGDYTNKDITQASSQECFPLPLRQWNHQYPDKSLLGIAVADDGKINRQKAFIRLVAYMLGVEFDTLWQRHKRFVRKLSIATISFLILALFAIYWFMIPIRLTVSLRSEKCQLPEMEYGVLHINQSDYSFVHPDTTLTISAIPGSYRLCKIPVLVFADRFYYELNHTFRFGVPIHQHIDLVLQRDSTFAIFEGSVFDGDQHPSREHPIEGALVTIGNLSTTTNEAGCFRVTLPLSEQRAFKPIHITHRNYQPYHREDEVPVDNLTYLLHRLPDYKN